MTQLLQKAMAAVSELPAAEQDVVASLILTELEAEDRWKSVLARDPEKLRRLADQALEDIRSGRTRDLNIDEI